MSDVVIGAPKSANLGPYIGTPTGLISPILDLIDVRKDDVLVDIGCGNARIAIEAAAQTGCRAIGIEINDQLITIARENVRQKGLEHLVEIVKEDASDSSFSQATVVFIFLPMKTVQELIPTLKNQLKKGARIVTHEQAKPTFAEGHLPDQSKLILADGAITVAHIWHV